MSDALYVISTFADKLTKRTKSDGTVQPTPGRRTAGCARPDEAGRRLVCMIPTGPQRSAGSVKRNSVRPGRLS